VRERLLREQGGFTLPEMLVTIMIMIVGLFALYSVFDMSIRVFSFGNDKTEAVQNARLGLEKMEREIRAAYPYDKANGNTTVLTAWTTDQITFGNDLNGNRVVDPSEVITYRRGVTDPTTLERQKGGSSPPVIEYVDSLSFQYLNRFDATASSEGQIAIVHINLTIRVDRGVAGPATQTLTTDVALRNRLH
jgi:prepilin-type N-terminal cleavage/methylation domain-containing protein